MDCVAVYLPCCVGMCFGAVARCASYAKYRETGYGLRGRMFVVLASS